jgi:UDPglucose--hexose-1-phosphate uridylyltransferase
MPALDISEHPHRRYNILTGEWILVSPHRTKRPWQGKVESLPQTQRPSYDPTCYLCPGNKRAGDQNNPKYRGVYSFVNDFAAILPEGSTEVWQSGLLQAKGEIGICKVVCFSHDHSLTMPQLSEENLVQIIELWQEEYQKLGAFDYIKHVQIFENKGEIMGCSNPHPHGQIWAQSSIPMEVQKKTSQQEKHWWKNDNSLLTDYLEQELAAETRIVLKNDAFVALVPFWAVWPFETMIIPRRQMRDISKMDEKEKRLFAAILKGLTVAYDRLFDTSFPYSAGIHQAPTDGQEHQAWHWHMCFYPPLLRSATVKKFMVGYEMLGEPQRDLSPEYSAGVLRGLI